jgi:hypothetical protein
MSKWIRFGTAFRGVPAGIAAAGCGDFVRQGTSPALARVAMLEGAAGATPSEYGNTLSSDVLTLVKKQIDGASVRVPTIFGDIGRVTVISTMKDTSITAPTPAATSRSRAYRVSYARADGRNTPGVDVPFGFDSAATFTVTPGGTATAGFDLVRNVSKSEAPLVGLVANQDLIHRHRDGDVLWPGQRRARSLGVGEHRDHVRQLRRSRLGHANGYERVARNYGVRLLGVVLAAAALSGCTLKDQDAPTCRALPGCRCRCQSRARRII